MNERMLSNRDGGSNRDGASTSLWMATTDAPVFAPLAADAHARVVVVGAGIAGLTTAWRLVRAGVDVVVLEEHDLHGGQTARTTGHLCDALDDRYYELEYLHGEQGARLAAHSHGVAVDTIEHICQQERIECGFRRCDGFLVRGEGKTDGADELDREFEAARRAGLQVERVVSPPGAMRGFGPALRFPQQARFHALEYTAGLARAIAQLGGRIHTHSRVVGIDGGANAGATLENGARVQAEHVVVATNVPFNDRLAIHTKQAAYRTYVVALRLDPGSVPDALLWDTLDPYHYVRIAHARNGTWLLVGGEDRKTGQDDAPLIHYEVLESWAREHFPMALDSGYRWSGQVVETIDGLGFLGHNPGFADNVYVATGDSGNGLTHGTIAGLIVADLIVDGDSPWRALYAPNRRTLRAADNYLKENLNFIPYYGEWVSEGDIEGLDLLQQGRARCCGAACTRSPRSATKAAHCTCTPRRVRTSAASCISTRPNAVGIARATARVSTRATAAGSTVRRCTGSRRSTSRSPTSARRRPKPRAHPRRSACNDASA